MYRGLGCNRLQLYPLQDYVRIYVPRVDLCRWFRQLLKWSSAAAQVGRPITWTGDINDPTLTDVERRRIKR